VQPNVGVKDDRSALEDDGVQDVRTQLNPPTASRDDVTRQRDARDAIGDPIPPGHQDHHVPPKNSGGETGESIRESLRNTGLTVNEPEGGLAARGVNRETVSPDDRGVRTVQDTLADHGKQHGEKGLSALDKRLGTADGDPDAVRGILSDTANIRGEGRKEDDPDFWLNPRSGRDTGDDKPSPSGIITDEVRRKRAERAQKSAETKKRNKEERERKKKEDDDKGDDDDKK
jgi:hypothetical protein